MISPESLINTSVDDCAASLNGSRDPAYVIDMATRTLALMNSRQLDHKSRRTILVREAKRAITELGNGYEKQAD